MIIDRECELDKWSVCCTTQLANADNYYTKKQTEQLIVEASGMTSGTVLDLVSDYTYDKETIDDFLFEKADIADIPTEVSELDNDLEFVSLEVDGTKLIFKTLNTNG